MGILNLFQYQFVFRGFEAGIIIAIIAPLVGIFLVLRGFSLIADTLSHVSLAGIAIGLLVRINPVIGAVLAATLSSIAIEKLRSSKKIYGESLLAIFLSGSLSIATILISIGNGFNTNLLNYLFGSLVTVQRNDIIFILVLGVLVLVATIAFLKELIFISFDEDGARVAGIPVNFINFLFVFLSALTIAIAIPIVGVLLISALIVIPAVSGLQLRKGFKETLFWSELFSLVSVISGIILSFYLNLSTGGVIVFVNLAILSLVMLVNYFRS